MDCHFTCRIEMHCAIHNFPKQTFAVLCANRDEICAGTRIIETLQTNRTAVMFIRVVFRSAKIGNNNYLLESLIKMVYVIPNFRWGRPTCLSQCSDDKVCSKISVSSQTWTVAIAFHWVDTKVYPYRMSKSLDAARRLKIRSIRFI